MKMLCSYGDGGQILAWNTEENMDRASSPFVEIEEDVWHQAAFVDYATHIDLPSKRLYRLEPEASSWKRALRSQVDGDAESARLKYITAGVGQAMMYQEKAAELARYDEDTQPRIAEYPLMGAEIGITADSLKGVADAIRQALTLWREKGAEIERVRLQAKADIDKASSQEAAMEILAGVEWP